MHEMPLITEKQFLTELRSWIGTPWMHSCAVKGAGVDCVMLLLEMGKFAGWVPQDYSVAPYPRDWALHRATSLLNEELAKYADPVFGDREVGDVLLYRFGLCNSHAGIYTGKNWLIHSHIQHGVEEIAVDDVRMIERMTGVMRFRGPRWAGC